MTTDNDVTSTDGTDRCNLSGCYDEAAGISDFCCPAHRDKAWAGYPTVRSITTNTER